MKRRSFVAALLAGVGLGRMVRPPAPAVTHVSPLLTGTSAGEMVVQAQTLSYSLPAGVAWRAEGSFIPSPQNPPLVGVRLVKKLMPIGPEDISNDLLEAADDGE